VRGVVIGRLAIGLAVIGAPLGIDQLPEALEERVRLPRGAERAANEDPRLF
jgi:hypothetical protein